MTGSLGRVTVWELETKQVDGQPQFVAARKFSSPHVHSGQWVDQVAWASPTSIAIISKSLLAHRDAHKSRTKTILLWTPDILDDAHSYPGWSAEELDLAESGELFGSGHVENSIKPPDGELAYSVERRAEWEVRQLPGRSAETGDSTDLIR